MKTTISSTKLGRVLTFTRSENFEIFVNINGRPDQFGLKILAGGGKPGLPILYSGDSHAEFRAACKKWMNAFVKQQTSKQRD